MKRILALAGTLVLAACSHDVRTPVPLGALVVPNQAPWLILAPGTDEVDVKGIDQDVKLTPDPALTKAVEAQLRAAVQKDYFNNLTIACDGPKAEMRGGSDDAPDTVTLDLALKCRINARGYVSSHDYDVQSATTVKAGSEAPAYASALVVLLRDASAQIAAKLGPDVRSSLPQ